MEPWMLIVPFVLVIFPPLGLILLAMAFWQVIGGADGAARPFTNIIYRLAERGERLEREARK